MPVALACRMATTLVSLPSTSSLVPGSRGPKSSPLYLVADPGLNQDPRRPRELQDPDPPTSPAGGSCIFKWAWSEQRCQGAGEKGTEARLGQWERGCSRVKLQPLEALEARITAVADNGETENAGMAAARVC